MLFNQLSIPKTSPLPTHIIDCGKSEAHYYHINTGQTGRLSHADLLDLNIPQLLPGSVVVVEEAHMRAREEISLAQPFTYQELLQIKTNADSIGVTILLFPQKTTPKARTIAGFDEKTDQIDVISIGKYLLTYPPALNALKKFQPTTLKDYQVHHKHQWEDRKQLTKDVNVARNRDYSGDAVSAWIADHISEIYDKFSPDERDLLDMKIVKKGKPDERIAFSANRLYTLVATLMRPNGELRLRSDVAKPPYWKYVKSVYFAMTPYHMCGGVVASNVKYHWRRASADFRKLSSSSPLLSDELKAFSAARSDFDKKLRSTWKKLRAMIVVQPN